ncbi:MAG: hypothetical protein R3195_13025 [Gemmatimonadota bacterium]|nr:hypothetical protein [Gemmatimonadota bacterium]
MTARRSLGWLTAACVVGFVVPLAFSSWLGWQRGIFLIPYVGITTVFLALYFRAHPMAAGGLLDHWRAGLALSVLASAFLVMNVLGQPASAVPEGAAARVGALLWMGLVYGAVDGAFLNVMPVLAVRRAWPSAVDGSVRSRLGRGAVALGASLLVTAAYHLGYAEFRGLGLLPVLLGNGIITATYLLSGSPLAPIATHVVMHVAAVMHGMETTLQLPPHYP